jgi:hypothetical protein
MRALFEKLIPPADKPVAGWHVSAFVDLCAYQFSWLWILIPLALAGDRHPTDYLALWAFGMTLSFLHRQYTMPYVFLDKQVFQQHITRFTLFFGLLMLGFISSVFMFRWKAPAGFFIPLDVAVVVAGLVLVVQSWMADKREHRFSGTALVAIAGPFTIAVVLGLMGLYAPNHIEAASITLVGFSLASVVAAREIRVSDSEKARVGATLFPVIVIATAASGLVSLALGSDALNANVVKGSAIVGVVGVIAAIWNIWHTLMQKFGIMRVYAAKSTVPLDKRTPPWVDRLMIFGSFPFLAVWIGPAQREVIQGQAKSITQYVMPAVDFLEGVQSYALVPAAFLAAGSVANFVWFEWKNTRFASKQRLSMAFALTALNLCFLFFSPLKVYIAYGFSHGIEYMTFVWAFLRRRYAQPQAHRPLIQRLLTRPVLAYGIFTLSIAAVFFGIEYGDDFGLHAGGVKIFDIKFGTWLFAFAIWQSIAHFYFDGFLWKMRAPAVRASL